MRDEELLRIKKVSKITGVGRSTIYKWMDEGRFPRPLKIGGRAIAWRQSDLNDWMASLPYTDNQR